MSDRDPLNDTELMAMAIIANAGDAKSFAFQALDAAKKGDFTTCDQLMENAKACSKTAHESQNELLAREARGESMDMNIIMVHAQDHMMSSMLAVELIEEMTNLYKIIMGV